MQSSKKIKNQIVHTRLSQSLFDSLKKKAEKHDISVSQMIRIVLQKAANPGTKISVGVSFENEAAPADEKRA